MKLDLTLAAREPASRNETEPSKSLMAGNRHAAGASIRARHQPASSVAI